MTAFDNRLRTLMGGLCVGLFAVAVGLSVFVAVAAVNVAPAPAGMLIPPSNTLIVYALVSSTSIATLFVAGYVPESSGRWPA